MQLAAGEEEPSSGAANIEDSQLAESFNQRLKELSGPSDKAFTGVLTGTLPFGIMDSLTVAKYAI